MKKLSLLFTLTVFALLTQAQLSNVILFSEQGERFTAILNGLRINDQPVTNLKIASLNAPNYKLKVIFENKSLGEMDKNLMTNPGFEVTWSIKKNNKGEYKIGFVSQVELAAAPPPASNQTLYTYGATGTGSVASGTVNSGSQTTVTTQQTTQTTNTGTNGGGINMSVTDPATGENVNVNMNVGVNPNGMGMNMNIGGTGTNTVTTNTQTTQTVTSGTSNSGTNTQTNTNSPRSFLFQP